MGMVAPRAPKRHVQRRCSKCLPVRICSVSEWTDEELLESLEQLWSLASTRHQHILVLLETVRRRTEARVVEARQQEQELRGPDDLEVLLAALMEAREDVQHVTEMQERVIDELTDRLLDERNEDGI